ncbi:MAG: hypothetical protein N2379_10385, partial [Verrucomicrobiae bacterium]|nr:hypothetical protein [Verrucomicrobiae bacterium]
MKEPLYPVKNQTGNERRIAFINSAGDIVFEIPGVVPLGILESRAFVHQKTHLLLIDDCGQPVAELKADWAETFVNGYCIVKVKHTDPDPLRIGMYN